MNDVAFIACKIDGCRRNSHRKAWGARGMCRAHYKRLMRYGDPLAGGTFYGDGAHWIESHIEHKGGECLVWPFARTEVGYPMVKIGAASMVASRYMCMKVNGPPPTPEHQAAHSCGNGRGGCMNPNHLYWATCTENANEKRDHGTLLVGEGHPNCKLTDGQVLEIRGDDRPLKVLAKKYGVSESTISIVRRGLRRVVVQSVDAP